MDILTIILIVSVGLVLGLPFYNYMNSKDPASRKQPFTTNNLYLVFAGFGVIGYILAARFGWMDSAAVQQWYVVVVAIATFALHLLFTKTAHQFNVVAFAGGAAYGISVSAITYFVYTL